MQPPSFIAFTGVDHIDLLPGMKQLAARYPIEWGVLVNPEQEDRQLFPNSATRTVLLAEPGLRWAAHICGASARDIVAAPRETPVAVSGVQRVQINHSFKGSTLDQITAARDYGRRFGVRTVLQCAGPFPDEAGVDWLYDVSFGTGLKPKDWPALPTNGSFCGYSGGIGPKTVTEVLERIAAPANALYWIDMESGVRSDGVFDLTLCEAVCRAVYG